MNRTIATWLAGLSRRRRLGEDGVSAVEFALFAPFMFIALLTMTDVGFAIHERMTLDTVLRAGAQAAMDDPGKAKVLEVLTATAAENFSAASGLPAFKVNDPDKINDPDKPWCECPENAGTSVTCTTICTGATATTSIYYILKGTKTYKGIFMSIDLGPEMRVQVR